MLVKQVSVFLENSQGNLAEVMEILESNNINTRALSIAETSDYGILRLIVNDYEKAVKALKEASFLVSLTDVIAIAAEDKPGGLVKPLQLLHKNNISVEYMYAFIGKSDSTAFVILRIDDTEKAIAVLAEGNINVLEANTLYQM